MLSLPYNALAWTQVVPGAGETFVQYNIYRDGVRIAIITAIGTLTYYDYMGETGVTHTYGISWTANIASTLLESTIATDTAALSFAGSFIHVIGTEATYLELPLVSIGNSWFQDTASITARGRRLPSVFVGERRSRELDLQLVNILQSDPTYFDAVDDMQDVLYTGGSTLCFRTGHMKTKVICKIDGGSLSRSDIPMFYQISLKLAEVYYDESV